MVFVLKSFEIKESSNPRYLWRIPESLTAILDLQLSRPSPLRQRQLR